MITKPTHLRDAANTSSAWSMDQRWACIKYAVTIVALRDTPAVQYTSTAPSLRPSWMNALHSAKYGWILSSAAQPARHMAVVTALSIHVLPNASSKRLF